MCGYFKHNQPKKFYMITLSLSSMIICIAHKKDLDGLGSHAIVRRYASKENLDIEHYFVSYDDLGKVFTQIEKEKRKFIVVADLGYNSKIPVDKVKELCKNNIFIWIDHHDWSSGEELLEADFKFIHSTELCAAELVWKHFLPEDKVAKEIAKLAHIHDFRQDGELAWKLYDVISSGYDKLKFVNFLAKGITWNEEFQEAYEKYQKAKEKGYAYLEEHLVEAKVGKYTCIIALSKKYLSSTLACLYLQEKGSDFVIVVYPDGKMSFRRNNPKVNLAKMAELFNGGGRAVAAGGKLDQEVNEENFKRVAEEIVKRISQKMIAISEK